ncbi:2-oxoacid dehydrogenases acyltransferase (catalytic domain) [Geoalkalibacter ferrihydriticus]|uniref:2-oxoacid dehydrogenases acyltransferase (Catalytic domain) n=1 Tax=Geoalkalibacter ferrihydriticus TaxID=392333 RepID=A0A1G9V886_9BACT|nr:2-oxo acid dehydrogenase subunit E2 [Geoalkalibacter ferrihydriticus]SDM68300.1 2-oxoacid dehydrogenases acyltransferase (catalytic domain) [Geoalkalibacter ferrihydriticus]
MEENPYSTSTPHKFFHVARSVVGKEVRVGNTITFINEIDLTNIETIRSGWTDGRKPTYTAFVAKAASLGLREFPYANRRLYRLPLFPPVRTRMQTFHDVNIAVACERNEPGIEVATFMDVLKDVDRLSMTEIGDWLNELAHCDISNNRQWRDFFNLICSTPGWLASFIVSLPLHFPRLWWKWRGGALVISSPGKYGVDYMIGAWPAPLGVSFGFAKERPVVRDGKLATAKTMKLTLNWDRRVMAGAQAARFFRRMSDILENPEENMKEWLR